MVPTTDPTEDPTTDPTADPTFDPTVDPTKDPTTDPTSEPTTEPTSEPTIEPTAIPSTSFPTTNPTVPPTDCQHDTETTFYWQSSTDMNVIESFINAMGPSSVTRIFGGIDYPNIHVWVANDNSGKQYDFKLTGYSSNVFVGENSDIDVAVNKVMFVGFKPLPSPYAYWVEEVANPLNYS